VRRAFDVVMRVVTSIMAVVGSAEIVWSSMRAEL